MWTVAIALGLTDVFAPYSSIKEDPRVWTTGESALFWSLKWSIWGLCIVWLIVACHYNYAGICVAGKYIFSFLVLAYASLVFNTAESLMNLQTIMHY
jgi:hypothetical protein